MCVLGIVSSRIPVDQVTSGQSSNAGAIAASPASRGRLPADWGPWLVVSIARAVCGVGFALFPVLEQRLGDTALVATCIGLAGITGAAAASVWYASRGPIRRDLAADIVTLLVLIPSLAVTASIFVADSRFGGRSDNFMAAILAVIFIFFIVALIGLSAPDLPRPWSPMAVLPAALAISAVIGSSGRFSAEDFWQGISLAWMVSAIATLAAGTITRLRSLLGPAVYFVFSLGIYLSRDITEESQRISQTSLNVALATVALIGIVIVFMALPARSQSRNRRRIRSDS